MSEAMTTEDLQIILYPDPRLRAESTPVEVFDDDLKALAARMLELMREDKGVGLAAPQVGINKRLFVINPTGKPADDRVYVNPQLSEAAGDDEGEEGCLSLPEIRAKVVRSKALHMRAQDVDGKWFEETADGYVARIWQHENDHLDGILILDKMGPLDKLAARRQLKKLEDDYKSKNRGKPRR
jgi:peptide deformylase